MSNLDIDLSAFKNAGDPAVRRQVAEWEGQKQERLARLERRKAAMAPPGALGLPPKLEERRIEFSIPDIVFTYTQPIYDRIFIFQVSQFKTDTYGDGGILVMTDEQQDVEKNIAPRGILVSAGLSALDVMWSHGFELGDMVNFVRFSAWRMRVGFSDGIELFVLPMRVGDLISSEDLAGRMRRGELDIRQKWTSKGPVIHYLGGRPEPVAPFAEDEA
jgi:hypothetical protein